MEESQEVKFTLRLPVALHQWFSFGAKSRKRSLNAHITDILEQSRATHRAAWRAFYGGAAGLTLIAPKDAERGDMVFGTPEGEFFALRYTAKRNELAQSFPGHKPYGEIVATTATKLDVAVEGYILSVDRNGLI